MFREALNAQCILAQAATRPSGPVLRGYGFLLLALTAMIGITALVVVMLLFRSWTRFNNRNRARRSEEGAEAEGEEKADPWSVAGQRAEPLPPETEDDEDDEEDEDEDDDEPKRR